MPNSEKENLKVVKKWVDAVNARDIKQIVNTLHAGYEYDLEYGSIKGKEAAHKAWEIFLDAFKDFHYEVVLMLERDGYVVSRLRMTAIHTGPFRFIGTNSVEEPISPKNRAIDVPTCAIHKIEDGQIIRMWSYWDTATLLRQMEG